MVPQRIDDDVVVELQYKLWSDGELIEESEADDPLVYLHGHDNIIPGLERELYGLSIGEEKEIVVSPEDGYGYRDPTNVEEVSLDELPLGFRPEPGMLLEVQDEDGNVYVAQVEDVGENTVTLDFNHPMAGKELRFQVRVTALREPTEEELEHGHVHDSSHHHH
ncbi:MAG: peptidylprolyl isomerase [Aggregatilineales bacterium]|nr:peptidylprolyl isomerase [Aggregatilineales bacterium]HPV08067.1 peptidylprolyl isomerase [Aggregatilineales bacterium]